MHLDLSFLFYDWVQYTVVDQNGTIGCCSVPLLGVIHAQSYRIESYQTFSNLDGFSEVEFQFEANKSIALCFNGTLPLNKTLRNIYFQQYSNLQNENCNCSHCPSYLIQLSRGWRCWTGYSVSTGSRTTECPWCMSSSIAPTKVKS